ncbi:phage antirepressor N-terminal domain-containing protein [Moraxella nasibovis]|uniref:phage antirepressor N-terminal domain-containing protein n=1 Tax=Moraxella nasibovis TaxID=2904120 RepID=UPI0024101E6D|nr:phage antirepressor N-terminal domain-containing protein [Moraxella nasibovis]WFF39296.1 phage antirepressor N-terminal domain-containing protein [Moraxella nasibovis]
MTNQIQTVNFHNQSLITLQKDNVAYVAMKPICENIGLDWEAQRQRISRDEVLNSVACMIKATGTDNKIYKMLCLPIHYLNGWLFGVDTNRVKAEIKETLITYKKECYQALFDYWKNGVAVNPRATKDERKPLVQAVNMLVAETGAIYSNVWKMIHQRFDVGCVDELTGEQVHQAVEYVHKLMLQAGSKVNAPFVQNIIADTAHQNRMAKDELGQMMAHFGKALDHIAELQNRLKRQEVLIDGAKRQLVA